MNIEQARFNMVEQQIRTWEVLDQRVLDLIRDVPREKFVPQEYRQLAFSDINIPLAHGEVMMAPKVEARMLQSLAIAPHEKILEIGTGSGYVTALLARSGREVTSIDIHQDFIDAAKSRLQPLGISNATLITGDGVKGWPVIAPCDVIAVTGTLPLYEPLLQQQLTLGGRLFVIVGSSPVMEALLITRVGEHDWTTETLFETDLPALVGASRPSQFVF